MEKIAGAYPGELISWIKFASAYAGGFLDKIRERLRRGCGYLETNIASSFCGGGGVIPGGELTSKITRREFPGKISRALLLSLGVFAHHLSAAGSDFVVSRQSSPTTSRRQTRTIVVSLRPPPLGGGLRLSSSVVYVVVSLCPAPRGARLRLYVVICPEPLAVGVPGETCCTLYSFK